VIRGGHPRLRHGGSFYLGKNIFKHVIGSVKSIEFSV